MSSLAGLSELLHMYFHQDWVDDFSDPWEVVDDFIREEPQLAAGLPAEVNGLLQENPSEERLKQLLVYELHCGYYMEADGWTYRGWLSAVADRVEQALHG